MAKFRITARRDGFRRAGIAHPAAPVEHRLADFTDEQIEALLGEEMLVIEPAGMPLEKWLEEAAADRERLREETAQAATNGGSDQDGKPGRGKGRAA